MEKKYFNLKIYESDDGKKYILFDDFAKFLETLHKRKVKQNKRLIDLKSKLEKIILEEEGLNDE